MEERMAVAITIVRCATVFLLGVPLLPQPGARARRLPHPAPPASRACWAA